LLPIFGFPQKYKKIQKKIYQNNIQKKSKKIIGARKECWNAEKMPKLVEEIKKMQKVEI